MQLLEILFYLSVSGVSLAFFDYDFFLVKSKYGKGIFKNVVKNLVPLRLSNYKGNVSNKRYISFSCDLQGVLS